MSPNSWWTAFVWMSVAAAWSTTASAHPWHRHRGDETAAGHANVNATQTDTNAADASVPVRLIAAPKPAAALDIADAFAAFEKRGDITTRRDDRWFFVESNGVPDHPLMVGIRAWQQQVPLPQRYVGDNAWRIPISPVPAAHPQTTKDRFLRGAIALAVNGIPIFNPLTNRGEDALAIGELDDYGGHCGRADDYHYHVAPLHLEKVVGKGKPIAYALDGYPIYGTTEPDGSPVKNLDWMGGHDDAQGRYHYHATKQYPYLNGGFRGEVAERDGQVDPQPRAQPIREAQPPLRGATIVGFESPAADTRLLTYAIGGRKGSVRYTIKPDGAVTFTFTDPQGRETSQTSTPRGPGGRGPRGSEGGPPRRPRPVDDRPPPPPQRDAAATSPAPAAAKPGAAGENGLGVTIPAIGPDGKLPVEFTCDGAGVSPPLAWQAGPKGTVCYAVALWHEAPDRVKSYWLVHDIPASVTALPKGSREIGTTGLNDKKRAEYDPMCSKGPGQKSYQLTVYALSAKPALAAGAATRDALLAAIQKTTLAEGTLTFTYERESDR
ncbi:MAG: YHYH protein [Pirellulales bacterium]